MSRRQVIRAAAAVIEKFAQEIKAGATKPDGSWDADTYRELTYYSQYMQLAGELRKIEPPRKKAKR